MYKIKNCENCIKTQFCELLGVFSQYLVMPRLKVPIRQQEITEITIDGSRRT